MLKKTVLRKKADFDNLYKKGKSAGDKYVVLFAKPNGLDYGRKAFLASKKVGNSVERNRARRLMREALRNLLRDEKINECVEKLDVIVIARSTIKGQNERDVEKSLKSALAKTGIIEKRS